MSPSEKDLRAALRHGEHDATDDLDVDRLVAAGRDRATQRRIRLVSGAAVALVVASAGVGGVLLSRGSDTGSNTAGQNPTSGNDVRHGPNIPASSGTNATPSAGPAGAGGCPATLPTVVDRDGRIASPAGTSGALFPEPVDQLVVCSYGAGGTSSSPISVVLRDAQADALRSSLENAAKVRPAVNCQDILRADQRELAVIGVTSSGKRLAPVITKINAVPCQVTVTNGATTRYDWSPPAALTGLAKRLTPATTLSPGVPGGGTEHGSPIHS